MLACCRGFCRYVSSVFRSGLALNKLETSSYVESIKLATILWGIWFWRNKKVWEDRIVPANTAMELAFNTVHEWRKARKQEEPASTNRSNADSLSNRKWRPLPQGMLKVNVDASVFPQSEIFSVGMVVRDHNGMFIAAKVMSLPRPGTILEAESIGVREALSWIMQRGDEQGIIESDSLLTIRALQGKKKYLLEVGHVVDSCKSLIQSILGFVFSYVRKQANKVAHDLARYPCSVNCSHVFTSPPSQLLETLKNDFPY